MVIDSSAIIAILLGEPEAERLIQAIVQDPICLMSSFSTLETAIVIEARKGERGSQMLDKLLQRIQIEICELDFEQFRIARDAWRKYGKGRHRAQLNIGDCCSYALAIARKEKLLFKGDDFSRTEIPFVEY